jgi:hypothetical protein
MAEPSSPLVLSTRSCVLSSSDAPSSSSTAESDWSPSWSPSLSAASGKSEIKRVSDNWYLECESDYNVVGLDCKYLFDKQQL